MATLTTGDWLGLEALMEEEEYLVSATSVRSARVLSLDAAHLACCWRRLADWGSG